MVLAADYPFMDIVWTMLIFFGWVIWIWVLVMILSDVFRRTDLGGWGKAGWTLLVIFLPLIGVFSYLIAHGQDMAERRAEDAGLAAPGRAGAAANGASSGAAAQIADAKRLLDEGALSEEEFARLKQKVLA